MKHARTLVPSGRSERLPRRRLFSLAAGAVLAAGLAGSGISVDAAAAELRVRIGSDIGVLDPATIFGIENQTVAGHIYNGLVKYDQATNEIQVRTSPPSGASRRTAPPTPSSSATASCGTRATGCSPPTTSSSPWSGSSIRPPTAATEGQLAGVTSVDAPDPLTVVVNLESPNAGLLNKLTAFNQGWIASRKAVTEIGEEPAQAEPDRYRSLHVR